MHHGLYRAGGLSTGSPPAAVLDFRVDLFAARK
jgi:hypothetical protein